MTNTRATAPTQLVERIVADGHRAGAAVEACDFHEVDKGGHFAAWEQPQLFAEEMRVAFRSLR
jgi:pimeloyl-ACP methyl ester carboxylesterase